MRGSTSCIDREPVEPYNKEQQGGITYLIKASFVFPPLRNFRCANEEEEVKSMRNWLSGKTEWLSGKTDKEIKERRKHGV